MRCVYHPNTIASLSQNSLKWNKHHMYEIHWVSHNIPNLLWVVYIVCRFCESCYFLFLCPVLLLESTDFLLWICSQGVITDTDRVAHAGSAPVFVRKWPESPSFLDHHVLSKTKEHTLCPQLSNPCNSFSKILSTTYSGEDVTIHGLVFSIYATWLCAENLAGPDSLGFLSVT